MEGGINFSSITKKPWSGIENFLLLPIEWFLLLAKKNSFENLSTNIDPNLDMKEYSKHREFPGRRNPTATRSFPIRLSRFLLKEYPSPKTGQGPSQSPHREGRQGCWTPTFRAASIYYFTGIRAAPSAQFMSRQQYCAYSNVRNDPLPFFGGPL